MAYLGHVKSIKLIAPNHPFAGTGIHLGMRRPGTKSTTTDENNRFPGALGQSIGARLQWRRHLKPWWLT
jgi:hypothetical protein